MRTCLGDSDADGEIGMTDISDVLGSWQADYETGTGPGDADGNGIVDFSDITAVLGTWGVRCELLRD